MARTGIRVSAIIIKNDKVLLIHRKKQGREYWVFPGGGIEEGETRETTIRREIKEETGLDVTKVELAFNEPVDQTKHPFYFCDVKEGQIKLGGPEADRQSQNNWYHPVWVKLRQVSTINLVPESAKSKLVQIIEKTGF